MYFKLLFQIFNDCKALSCRAIWRVCADHIQLAQCQIASKRLELDDVLCKINGVQYFFSCISCVASNARSSQAQRTRQSYPAIAYFVVYRETAACNEQLLFAAMHDHDMDAEISHIRVRSVDQVERAARQLFQVVKDHNNPTIQEMLDVSNVYCYGEADDSLDDDSDDEINPSRFPMVPLILVVVNEREFGDILERACNKLRSDGLVVVIDASRDQSSVAPAETTGNEVTVLIKKIAKAMELCTHAIYRSQVYARPDGASFTYVRMMDVTSYLHKLLANDFLRDGVMKHFQLLEKFLAHPACEIIAQLEFNNDLIEVSNGFCFSVRQRRFIPCPLVPSMCRKRVRVSICICTQKSFTDC